MPASGIRIRPDHAGAGFTDHRLRKVEARPDPANRRISLIVIVKENDEMSRSLPRQIPARQILSWVAFQLRQNIYNKPAVLPRHRCHCTTLPYCVSLYSCLLCTIKCLAA